MAERFAVIMAGGRGERFWPASRWQKPKHLLPIVGDKPMLTQTVDRLKGLVPSGNIIVITNRQQIEGVREVCPNLPDENILAEPVGRDTAAAVGLAMLVVKQRSADAALAMLPADALIKDAQGFRDTLAAAFEAAETSPSLLTIGIKPTEPATGYGYVQRGSEALQSLGRSIYDVAEFKEKPDLETAKAYLESGDYYWNAGMFVWRVSTISDALEEFTPVLKQGLDEIEKGLEAGRDMDSLLEELYPSLEKISVDFAVMEKATNVKTVESTFDWDDVGSWTAIERHFPKDSEGNTINGLTSFGEASGNIVVGPKDKLIALLGVDDLIVVQTEDATLICRKDQAQRIKTLVKDLSDSNELSSFV